MMHPDLYMHVRTYTYTQRDTLETHTQTEIQSAPKTV